VLTGGTRRSHKRAPKQQPRNEKLVARQELLDVDGQGRKARNQAIKRVSLHNPFPPFETKETDQDLNPITPDVAFI
jgi:hypothetical protein